MREVCVCGCGRFVSNSSSYATEQCAVNYNNNDAPYEKDDEKESE